MALSLKSLMILANFPKEKIDKLMEKIDYVTEEEKLKLTNLAWFLISQKYSAMVNLRNRQLLEEVAQGKREYNKNDFEEAKAKYLHELLAKLQKAETETSIDEVREQLEKYKTPPIPQDTTVSPPPQKT